MKPIFFTACAACIVLADMAVAKDPVLVSCYRGPWDEVIWDRANPKFIDSLKNYGFNDEDATEIANTICRDPRLVDKPDLLAEQVRKVVLAGPDD